MPHILVVDDDERLRALLSRYLADHGFVVTTARNARDAIEKIELFVFDLMILDVMMPGEDGISLTRRLRGGNALPILLLTARGETEDRIEGLEAGADDYLTKPFEPKELLLRVHSILRRASSDGRPAGDRRQRIGKWLYDADRGELSFQQQAVRLTETENRLLKILTQNAGEPVTREALSDGTDAAAAERTVDVQITRLRKKIEDDPANPRHLLTVRGKGYVLRVDG